MSTHAADRVPLLRLGPTRALARRSSLLRCCLALAIAAFGCVQVLAVENGAAGTLVGAGLVALAAPLARGRRRALLATAALVLASLVLDEDAVAWPGLAAVVLLMALLVGAPAFRASGDPATRRLIVPAAALLAIGLVADLARACGQLAHPLGATLLVGAGMLGGACTAPVAGRRRRRAGAARARGPHRRRARDRHARAVRAARRQAVLLRPRRRELHRLSRGRRRRARLGRSGRRRESLPGARRRPSRASPSAAAGRSACSAQAPSACPLWRDVGLRAHYTGDEAIVDPRGVLARGARDPQGAPIGHPARARGVPGRGRARRARSTSHSRRASPRSPRAGAATAARPATRWRSPARASTARATTSTLSRATPRASRAASCTSASCPEAARSRSRACGASATRPTASTSS